MAAPNSDSLDAPLPFLSTVIHVSSTPAPDKPFGIYICSGVARAGDVTSWMHMLNAEFELIRIDEKVGGYEHRIDRPEVRQSGFAL